MTNNKSYRRRCGLLGQAPALSSAVTDTEADKKCELNQVDSKAIVEFESQETDSSVINALNRWHSLVFDNEDGPALPVVDETLDLSDTCEQTTAKWYHRPKIFIACGTLLLFVVLALVPIKTATGLPLIGLLLVYLLVFTASVLRLSTEGVFTKKATKFLSGLIIISSISLVIRSWESVSFSAVVLAVGTLVQGALVHNWLSKSGWNASSHAASSAIDK